MARTSRQTRTTVTPQAQAGKARGGKAGQPAAPPGGRDPLSSWRPARRLARGCRTGAGTRRAWRADAAGGGAGGRRVACRADPSFRRSDGVVERTRRIGFRRFNAAMVAAGESETHPLLKGLARAKAYVAYAQAHPGMYGLMFRTERLDMSRPSLHEAAAASFEGLASAVGAGRNEKLTGGGSADAGPGRGDRAGLVAGAWLHHAAARRPAQDILRRLPAGTGSTICWMRCCDRLSPGRRWRRARQVAVRYRQPTCATSAAQRRAAQQPRQIRVCRARLASASASSLGRFPQRRTRLGIRPGRGAVQRPEDDLAVAGNSSLAGFFSSPGAAFSVGGSPNPSQAIGAPPSASSRSRCRTHNSQRGRCRRRAER